MLCMVNMASMLCIVSMAMYGLVALVEINIFWEEVICGELS